MGIDYSVKIIQGFLADKDKLFKEEKIASFQCSHEFDRSKCKHCPECGRSSAVEYDTDFLCLVEGLDEDQFDFLLGWGLELEDIVVVRMTERKRDTFFVGILSAGIDPRQDLGLKKIDLVTREEVLEKINNLNVKIPFNEETFGIYLLVDSD